LNAAEEYLSISTLFTITRNSREFVIAAFHLLKFVASFRKYRGLSEALRSSSLSCTDIYMFSQYMAYLMTLSVAQAIIIVSNCRMSSESRFGKSVEGNVRDILFHHLPQVTEENQQNTQSGYPFSCRYLNLGPPEYEARVPLHFASPSYIFCLKIRYSPQHVFQTRNPNNKSLSLAYESLDNISCLMGLLQNIYVMRCVLNLSVFDKPQKECVFRFSRFI
jgi:hypothetical protein